MSWSVMLLVGMASAMFTGEAAWKSDYADARKVAQSEKKPILVYFMNSQSKGERENVVVDGSLLEPFVLVKADRATEDGKRLFKLFEMNSDSGVVVVEKELNWQFCRYERRLDSSELSTVLRETSRAQGRPASSVLASVPAQKSENARTSFYPPNVGDSANPSGGAWMMPSYGSCPNCRRY